MLPPPTTLTCTIEILRIDARDTRPDDRRRVEHAVLGHRSRRVVETHRTLCALRARRNATASTSMMLPTWCATASPYVFPDLFTTRRARTGVCGTRRPVCTTVVTSSSTIVIGLLRCGRFRPVPAALAKERVTVRVGDDLHGLPALDRIRRDEVGHAAGEFDARSGVSRRRATISRICDSVSGSKKTSAQRDRIAGSISLGSRVVAPIKYEIRGRAVVEELLHVGRNARIGRIVIRRFEREALVLEHFEQLRLQHRHPSRRASSMNSTPPCAFVTRPSFGSGIPPSANSRRLP